MRYFSLYVNFAVVTFLLLSATGRASAATDMTWCGVDAIMRNTAASALTPTTGSGDANAMSTVARLASTAPTFEPIRIGVFFESLYNDSLYCVNATANVVEYGTMTRNCTADAVLTDAKRDMFINSITPAAVELLEERLQVKRLADPIKVPYYLPDKYCGQVTIPDTHHTDGVSKYDIVFYVTAKPTESGTDAWALTCTDNDEGRAVVAVVNFNPKAISGSDTADVERGTRMLAHEMIHGLGFARANFANKALLVNQNVSGSPYNANLIGGTVLQTAVMDHFRCPNRQSLPLTDDASHWPARYLKNDIMTATMGNLAVISAVTLAALEATGHYKAIAGMAEVSAWGYNVGCPFLTDACLSHRVSIEPSTFCTAEVGVRCNKDRFELGPCTDASPSAHLPDWAQGYGRWSSDASIDYCPVYSSSNGTLGTLCTDATIYSSDFDSVQGPNSRCLDASPGSQHSTTQTTYGVCADIKCLSSSYQVRFTGNDWMDCEPGKTLDVTFPTSGNTRKVSCPQMYEVCIFAQHPSTLAPITSRTTRRTLTLGAVPMLASVSVLILSLYL